MWIDLQETAMGRILNENAKRCKESKESCELVKFAKLTEINEGGKYAHFTSKETSAS